MKQVLQNLNDGRTTLWEVPIPVLARGSLMIATTTTLLSSGTERMLVDFGRASLLGKAMQQPERVRDAWQKVRSDGVAATLAAINDKLDQPLPLGYCNVGVVTAVGADVGSLKVGDRVVSNGKHAEYVTVGENLCVRIPDNVCDDDATFAIPAAIGLQGVRLAAPTLGETFVVIGLGLIGLLTVQILIANGCRVIGIDRDPTRAQRAAGFGASLASSCWNFWKSRARSSGAIPGPWSTISKRARSPRDSARRRTAVPGGENFTAFERRFVRT